MIALEKKDLNVIKMYCGSEYVQKYNAILKKSKQNIIKVVNTGMVSSGKSSLFNALINKSETEYFPTGAARTTTLADFYDCGNISYVDTPGIDVRLEDDMLAYSTILESDIIMMVHNIRTGPLNRSETDWLERIVAGMKDEKMREARLIFVCTWKDTREKDIDYEDILSNIKKMVYDIVGTQIPFFDVSVKKYQTGILKDQELLQKNSGILELKEYLENYSQLYVSKKNKMIEEELSMLIHGIKKLLSERRKEDVKKIATIEKNERKTLESKRISWKQVFDYFSMQKRELKDLKREKKELEG